MAVLVIAEAGVNHNGRLDYALELVDVAAASGADIVKFQTFSAEQLASDLAPKAGYQIKVTDEHESQIDMLRKLELSREAHFQIQERCRQKGIEFLSTAFEASSLKFLADELQVSRLKIPSGEITNLPFVYQHGQTGKDIIISTGMATVDEISRALDLVAAGYAFAFGVDINPSDCLGFALSPEGRSLIEHRVSILHCTTAYPAPPESLNLSAIPNMSRLFDLPIGYSDHSQGIWAPIYAIAMGASIIEKHFTLDRSLPGPDHQASLPPEQLKEMIAAIRESEQAAGDGQKVPSSIEMVNRVPARKSLFVSRDIRQGQIIVAEDLAAKRPALGMSPAEYWAVQGKPASRDYVAGELLDE